MDANRSDTIQAWRASQRQLDEAIQNYLQCTIALDSVPSHTIDHFSRTETGSGSIWHDIHDNAQAMPSRIQTLETGMRTLWWIRNKSPSLVPINKLPPEILVRIFGLCTHKSRTVWGDKFTCGFYHHELSKLIDLSRVCSHWRGLVIYEPTFWSHLRFKPDQRYQNTNYSWEFLQKTIERSSGQHICLTIPGNNLEETEAGLGILKSFGSSVKHLCIHSCQHYRVFLPWFFENIHVPNIQSFALAGQDKAVSDIFTYHDETYPKLSKQEYEPTLLSIRSLHLERASFNWASPVYRNLVSLTLHNVTSGPRKRPTADDILSVLAVSPQLHTLRLRTEIFIGSNKPPHAAQVHFGALKNLDLRQVNAPGVTALLPRLHISSRKLSFSFGLDVGGYMDGQYLAALKEFLARVNVTRLLMENDFKLGRGQDSAHREQRMTSVIRELCSMVPILPSLTLIGDWKLNLLKTLTRETSQNEHEACFPMLRTFYAVGWALNRDDLENIGRAYPFLEKMCLVGCKLPADPEFDEWLGHEVKYMKITDQEWVPQHSSRDYADPI